MPLSRFAAFLQLSCAAPFPGALPPSCIMARLYAAVA